MRASSLHAKNGVGSRPEAGSRPSLRSDAARRWRRRLGVACRLIGARIALFLLVTVLAFAILRAMPADPVLITLAERNLPATPEAVAVLTRHFGLDRPIPEQYARWLVRFLSGDWSVSLRTDLPVRAEISARAPLSLAIGGGGLAVAILLAVPLGFAASARPRGLADRLSRLLAVAAQAVPVFWVGLMLLWLLGVHLRLFQPYGSDGATRLLLSV
ncbi:MAG: ABC transporter permease, partial [Alphaproteobacteria bacterium]|nr:ABC transporter permease [Alphaproteobacteria bacterium]